MEKLIFVPLKIQKMENIVIHSILPLMLVKLTQNNVFVGLEIDLSPLQIYLIDFLIVALML